MNAMKGLAIIAIICSFVVTFILGDIHGQASQSHEDQRLVQQGFANARNYLTDQSRDLDKAYQMTRDNYNNNLKLIVSEYNRINHERDLKCRSQLVDIVKSARTAIMTRAPQGSVHVSVESTGPDHPGPTK